LQIPSGTKDALREQGIRNVADLIHFIGSQGYSAPEFHRTLDALNTLASVSSPAGPDWYAYWEAKGFEFHEMCLTCHELEEFDENTPVCAINRESFGNAGAMLARGGYDTLGALAEGLRSGIGDVAGMGGKKRADFFSRLVDLVYGLREGQLSSGSLASRFPLGVDGDNGARDTVKATMAYEFHEDVLSLGIGVLHAGAKTKALIAAGYRNVGDLAAVGSSTLIALPGMGRSTVRKIEKSLQSLQDAQDEAGNIDWDRYCDAIDVPLLPVENGALDGNSFAAMVGVTLGQLGQTLHDPVLQKIIAGRISKPPHQRATLEDIGSSLPEPITRERVRQKEAKLLAALAAGLVNDDYAHLEVHFRPEFANYWKRAATHFADAEEDITFAALVDGLIEIWGADRAILLEHLPLIATVITGEVMTTSAFGDATRLDPRLLTLSEADRSIPLRHLQIGRAARALRRHGIETIGDLISSIRQGTVSRASGAHYRTAIAHLDQVVASLDAHQRFDRHTYLENTGVPALPENDPSSPADFMQNLAANVSEILAANPPRMRSREIFVLRTARPIATRLTMEKTAEVLDTYGPSVKREETDTLEWLNEVILRGDQALAGIALRPVFSRTWQRINEVFDEANGDAELFQRYLAATFGIEESDVEPAMPTMIAVLTGYPYGRLGRYTRMSVDPVLAEENTSIDEDVKEVAADTMPARIKLKGFRRTH
jgi:hypothetical protein